MPRSARAPRSLRRRPGRHPRRPSRAPLAGDAHGLPDARAGADRAVEAVPARHHRLARHRPEGRADRRTEEGGAHADRWPGADEALHEVPRRLRGLLRGRRGPARAARSSVGRQRWRSLGDAVSAAGVAVADIPWSRMTAKQRKQAAAALMAEAGDDPARRLAATAASPQLVLRAGVYLLGVEHPRHGANFIPTETVDPGTIHKRPLDGNEIEAAYCAGEVRLYPIGEALNLIADPAGPENELANRRAEIAERRRVTAERQRLQAETKQREAAEREQWQYANADRLAAWEKFAPEVQRLHVAAERMPQHRALLMLL